MNRIPPSERAVLVSSDGLLVSQKKKPKIASAECEKANDTCPAAALREALNREQILVAEKNDLIRSQQVLTQECDHRLLNSLQMISSLLSLQARAASGDAASQLATASARVAALGRIHRRLHGLDRGDGVSLKHYLEDICGDISEMLSVRGRPAAVIVKATDLTLPTARAMPLGFIVNELITNAAKYGEGQITVVLEPHDKDTYVLSVSNNGPPLSDRFDPGASKGLGMRLIRSFVAQLGGELLFSLADGEQGARFSVRFPGSATAR